MPSSLRRVLPAVALFVVVILFFAVRACQTARVAQPTCASLAPWQFYGGAWSSDGGLLEATRNGRGDMAISRDRSYRDFEFSVQMQLRDLYPGTNYGDAGVLFRVRNPYIGVDSYNGYYLGLRASDHALFFGRVDGEWKQLLYTLMPAPLAPGAWYTLSVKARGCRFSLSAQPTSGGPVTGLRYTDAHCLSSGSVGMRVYYVKAAWRDLKFTAH